MKIGFYNPYFDGWGGGERYALTLASHWSKNHDVFLFWDDDAIRGQAADRFRIDLSRVRTTSNIFRGHNLLDKAWKSRAYDLIFFLSDGSVPTTLAKHNILHFQVPFATIRASRFKLSRYDAVVCNSKFTKDNLDRKVGRGATVVYPPVDVSSFSGPHKKEHIILSVGRFSGHFEAKKQDVLIDVFREMLHEDVVDGWKLVLAGGLLDSDRHYFEKLKTKAHGLPVDLQPNIDFRALVSLYGRASLYWHAAGFGETDPEHMEHFGISTVEAMAAGCVPLVFGGGGQKEIVSQGIDGFLWSTKDQLRWETIKLVSDEKAMGIFSVGAKKSARRFDKEVFQKDFDTILRTMHI